MQISEEQLNKIILEQMKLEEAKFFSDLGSKFKQAFSGIKSKISSPQIKSPVVQPPPVSPASTAQQPISTLTQNDLKILNDIQNINISDQERKRYKDVADNAAKLNSTNAKSIVNDFARIYPFIQIDTSKKILDNIKNTFSVSGTGSKIKVEDFKILNDVFKIINDPNTQKNRDDINFNKQLMDLAKNINNPRIRGIVIGNLNYLPSKYNISIVNIINSIQRELKEMEQAGISIKATPQQIFTPGNLNKLQFIKKHLTVNQILKVSQSNLNLTQRGRLLNLLDKNDKKLLSPKGFEQLQSLKYYAGLTNIPPAQKTKIVKQYPQLTYDEIQKIDSGVRDARYRTAFKSMYNQYKIDPAYYTNLTDKSSKTRFYNTAVKLGFMQPSPAPAITKPKKTKASKKLKEELRIIIAEQLRKKMNRIEQ